MVQDSLILLERLSGHPPRRYSTYDFGRKKDEQCISVVVPEGEADSLVSTLRSQLPSGLVAFVGTSNWLGDERHDGKAEVVIGKGGSQFEIVRLARTDACNYDMDTETLIKKLQSWDHSYGIDIYHAETDTIELTMKRVPDNPRQFANEVYVFCPDIVDSVDELEKTIRDYQYLYLWWD